MDCSQKAISSSFFSDQELRLAIAFQQHLLPSPPQLQGFEIATYSRPAHYLTGDFYDFVSLSNSCLGLLIGDASGKSLPASLLMTFTLSLFRSLAPHYHSPSALLKELNRQLHPGLSNNLFVTACYGILNLDNCTLTLARAGHEPPFHCGHSKVQILRSPGMALGIDKGPRFDSLITDSEISLKSGDTVTFFTDGVNEAMDLTNEEFSMERLKQTLEKANPQGAKALLDTILKTLDNYRNSAPQSDDVTLITLYAS